MPYLVDIFIFDLRSAFRQANGHYSSKIYVSIILTMRESNTLTNAVLLLYGTLFILYYNGSAAPIDDL